MEKPLSISSSTNDQTERASSYSLRELVDMITGRTVDTYAPQADACFVDIQPFPFMAIVGQQEMKTALLLAMINPLIGGVLLIGPRGTGKTTAVRSMADLMPVHLMSNCYYGCLPEDIETGGMDAVCPDCARKFGEGQPLTKIERARLVELPLNASLEDVIGGIDERVTTHNRLRLKRGLLAQANMNLLYVDEVNLLADEIVDAILDAAAMGSYTIRRRDVSATYKSRLTIIGSMNPEEGNLRPQILDRFGLRVLVRGLDTEIDRLEAFRRASTYRNHPAGLLNQFVESTEIARREVQAARDRLPTVEIPENIAHQAIHLIRALNIDSLRAEMTLLQASLALAAADGRSRVELEDIKYLAPMALRLRRSLFIEKYFEDRARDDQELQTYIKNTFGG